LDNIQHEYFVAILTLRESLWSYNYALDPRECLPQITASSNNKGFQKPTLCVWSRHNIDAISSRVLIIRMLIHTVQKKAVSL